MTFLWPHLKTGLERKKTGDIDRYVRMYEGENTNKKKKKNCRKILFHKSFTCLEKVNCLFHAWCYTTCKIYGSNAFTSTFSYHTTMCIKMQYCHLKVDVTNFFYFCKKLYITGSILKLRMAFYHVWHFMYNF